MLGMQLPQALTRNMGVDLRGRDIRMAKQHLHHTQIRAMIEQVRGKSVPKRMR